MPNTLQYSPGQTVTIFHQVLNSDGYRENGYVNIDGYVMDGYIISGYLLDGYTVDGYIIDGYIGNRFDGYSIDGYVADGYIINGYIKDGYGAPIIARIICPDFSLLEIKDEHHRRHHHHHEDSWLNERDHRWPHEPDHLYSPCRPKHWPHEPEPEPCPRPHHHHDSDTSYPIVMTYVDTGLYVFSFTLPKGASAVGTYLVDIFWYHPTTFLLQQDFIQVIVNAPYGIYNAR